MTITGQEGDFRAGTKSVKNQLADNEGKTMRKHQSRKEPKRRLSGKGDIGIAVMISAAAAGWGPISDHPPAPTPACAQINGPVSEQPV